jgi:hypothetical protein
MRHAATTRRRSPLGRAARSLALAAALLGAAACESQYQDNWSKVRLGMTKEQVEALLGKPSSTYAARTEDGKVVVAEDRWQYGDNLSTLATGAMFPAEAHPRAWAIKFDAAGRVSSIQVPDWQHKN